MKGADKSVRCFDPAIELSLLGADTFSFHLADVWPFVNGGNLVDSLPRVGAVIDAAGDVLFFKAAVDQIAPRGAPCFQCFGCVPVRGVDGIEDVLAVAITDAVAVFVEHVFSMLLGCKRSICVERAHGGQHMKVRV